MRSHQHCRAGLRSSRATWPTLLLPSSTPVSSPVSDPEGHCPTARRRSETSEDRQTTITSSLLCRSHLLQFHPQSFWMSATRLSLWSSLASRGQHTAQYTYSKSTCSAEEMVPVTDTLLQDSTRLLLIHSS